jgi:hypothetical protein
MNEAEYDSLSMEQKMELLRKQFEADFGAGVDNSLEAVQSAVANQNNQRIDMKQYRVKLALGETIMLGFESQAAATSFRNSLASSVSRELAKVEKLTGEKEEMCRLVSSIAEHPKKPGSFVATFHMAARKAPAYGVIEVIDPNDLI